MLKKVWFRPLTDDDSGAQVLCIRMMPDSCPIFKKLGMSTMEFPPDEPVDGKKLNIDEAKALGLEEAHHVIYSFDREDLMLLKEAIERLLYE